MDDFGILNPDPGFNPQQNPPTPAGATVGVAEPAPPPPPTAPDAPILAPDPGLPPVSDVRFPLPDPEDEEEPDVEAYLRPVQPRQSSTKKEEEDAYAKYLELAGPSAMVQTDRHLMLARQNAWAPLRGWTYCLVPTRRFHEGQFIDNETEVAQRKAEGWIIAEIPKEYEPFHDPSRFTVLMKADRQVRLENERAIEELEAKMTPRQLTGHSNAMRGDVGDTGYAEAKLTKADPISLEEAITRMPETEEVLPDEYRKLLMGEGEPPE